jgi:hypothetical protein
MPGTIAVSVCGFAAVSGDALGEVQPCFGDNEQTRFIGKHGCPFCQIKAGCSQSPVLEFHTHFQSNAAAVTLEDGGSNWANIRRRPEFHGQRHSAPSFARKIFAGHERIASASF